MKILVVDDSIVFRTSITQALNDVEGYNVFKTCSNGKIALDFLMQNPDTELITLDMEMPVMDGLETIKEIRKFNSKVLIVVFSSFTKSGAEKTIDALAAGANDFVTKVEGKGTIEDSLEAIKLELVPKIEALKIKQDLKNGVKTNVQTTIKKESLSDGVAVTNIDEIVSKMSIKPKLIAIGCSTGGPDALKKIFDSIDFKISVPVVIVQHMPPMFTQKLAELLNKNEHNTIVEAKEGDTLEPGKCLIAPGDYHMTVTKESNIKLNQDEKVCFVRPSVDVLFESICKNFNSQVLTIVLTGMGEDGARGVVSLNKNGSYNFIQDQESSVVWGMPGAVSRMEPNHTVIDIKDFSKLIKKVSERI